jgi:hypothetical protein
VVLFSLANLIVSVVTCVFAWKTYELGKGSSETQVFHSLRAGYTPLAANLHPDLLERPIGPKQGDPEWDALRAYWEHAITEWFTTTRINGGQYKELWKSFYEPVLANSLSRPAFRDVLCDMRDSQLYTRDRYEFFQAMEELYVKSTGKPLRKTTAKGETVPAESSTKPPLRNRL